MPRPSATRPSFPPAAHPTPVSSERRLKPSSEIVPAAHVRAGHVAERLEPRILLATFEVTNTDDRPTRANSLRWAINQANAAPGLDLINFRIGSGAQEIRVGANTGAGLPAITDPVIIDGRTQPGWAGTPLITIRGDDAGLADGLRITAGSSSVIDLAIRSFAGDGIELSNGGGNTVVGCRIGMDANGTVRPNNGNGIHILSGNNGIGVTPFGVGARNVISNNAGAGVSIEGAPASGNTVQGNYIGTFVSGTDPFYGNDAGGIVVRGAGNNQIGGPTPAARNVIAFNSNFDVLIADGAAGNRVQGNYVGLDANGAFARAPTSVGVFLSAASNNLVGGTAGERNVIAGETAGVLVGPLSNANQIVGNYVGTRANGSEALGNTVGVEVNGSDNLLAGNLISGNLSHGVVVARHASGLGTASGNRLEGNLIGTDATGSLALGNGGDGVRIDGGTGNLVGNPAGPRNVISGNGGNGVHVRGPFPGQDGLNRIQNNYIGVIAAGTFAAPNAGHGALLGVLTYGNTVGGTEAGAGNVISGNGGAGVYLESGPNTVQGNLIGTTPAGDGAIGNIVNGVIVAAPGNLIGGTTPAARNVISGNDNNGIEVVAHAPGGPTLIRGNYIGTSAAGSAAVPNALAGVRVGAANVVVGGNEPGAGNVISGNTGNGVALIAAGAIGALVRGNRVGTAADGAAPLPNVLNGVRIDAGANVVGGAEDGSANVIAFNRLAGVSVRGGGGNGVLSNSVFSNGTLGIDLGGDGLTANDPGDSDAGANGLQNYPVLSSAVSSGSETRIVGSLDSTPATSFRLEFFASAAADPTAFGEGERFVGAATVTTDAAGVATFDVTLPAAVPVGQVIAATATGQTGALAGSTSEFSRCVQVAAAPPRVTQVFLNGPGLSGDTTGADETQFRVLAGIDPSYGYAVPAGTGQTRPVPWVGGINGVSVRFDQDMAGQIDRDDLQVRGVVTSSYALGEFAYDAATRTATWALESTVAADRLRLVLDDAGITGLDGEWQNSASAQRYPSGDGTAGGDFDFRVDVLAGDATGDRRVNALDLAAVRQRLGRTASNPGAGSGAYGVFADLTGDGRINALDLAAAKQRLNRSLPVELV